MKVNVFCFGINLIVEFENSNSFCCFRVSKNVNKIFQNGAKK